MSSAKNYYKILQVDPQAEPEVIVAAYKRLSIKYHPDTNPTREANRVMQEINEAYQVLKDPVKRRQYDRSRGHSQSWQGYESPRWDSPPPGSRPDNPSQDTSLKPRPASALANMFISLTFPVTYSLTVFILFRIIRPFNIFAIIFVLVVAGIVAYYATSRVDLALRKKK
jgi:curved DNA-binding protein CbpA